MVVWGGWSTGLNPWGGAEVPSATLPGQYGHCKGPIIYNIIMYNVVLRKRNKCSLTRTRSPWFFPYCRMQHMPHWDSCIRAGKSDRLWAQYQLLAYNKCPFNLWHWWSEVFWLAPCIGNRKDVNVILGKCSIVPSCHFSLPKQPEKVQLFPNK